MEKKTKSVLVKMIFFTAFLATLMAAFFVLYNQFHIAWMLSVSITMMTIFYHFAMRLAVGELVTVVLREKELPQDRFGFTIHDFEHKLYKKLKVKKWKTNLITAKPEQFDINLVTPEQLLHNIMQAELVHRIIMILSFVPLFFIIPFGVPLVFILTSIFACMIDLIFVIIQRYNRPRAIAYMEITKRKRARSD